MRRLDLTVWPLAILALWVTLIGGGGGLAWRELFFRWQAPASGDGGIAPRLFSPAQVGVGTLIGGVFVGALFVGANCWAVGRHPVARWVVALGSLGLLGGLCAGGFGHNEVPGLLLGLLGALGAAGIALALRGSMHEFDAPSAPRSWVSVVLCAIPVLAAHLLNWLIFGMLMAMPR